MTYMCTKFDNGSFSHSRVMIGAPKFNIGHVTTNTSIWGTFFVSRLILHMGSQCTEFEIFSFSHSSNILGGLKKLHIGHMTWPHPIQGQFVICRLGLSIINQSTKFEVSRLTHYEDTKGSAKCQNWNDFGWLGVTQGHRQPNHLIKHIQFSVWI